MEAAPHVEAISEGTQRGIEAADGVVGLCAQEHTGCSDTQHIGCSVVLSLIDLILADAFESTSAGSGKNAEFEEPRAIPAHLFRANCSHGFADGARLSEFSEAVGFGGGVLVEDPPPRIGGEGGVLRVRPSNRVTEVAGPTHANEPCTMRDSVGGEGCDMTSCNVNDGKGIRSHRLIFDGP